MTLDKFTIKAQEAVQEAVNTAQRNGQQTIEPVHLLAGVMNKAKDVVNFLLQKLGVNAQQIDMLVQSELQHLPRVTGGEPYLSSDAKARRQVAFSRMPASRRRSCVQPSRLCAKARRYSRSRLMTTISRWRSMPRTWWIWLVRVSSTP